MDKVALPDKSFRALVMEEEQRMLAMPQLELKVVIHKAPGIHARELHIPARTALTGRIHKFDNLNTLSDGKMLIAMDDGWYFVQAPYTVVSPAGTKRMAITLTDCVWTTYVATNEPNADAVMDEFTCLTEDEFNEAAGILNIEGK